jgi:putative nucleotidyltransferase with HDIG domain
MSDDHGSLAEWARAVAAEHLTGALPRRWSHVQGAADQAAAVAAIVGEDADLLVAAAWLHDVGYAPDLADTGFHPLDGAAYLRRIDAPERLVCLVAHHTCALLEADMRGLASRLEEQYPREESATADALWYADLTTGPDGQRLDVYERLAEVRARYGPDDLVSRFIDRARSELVGAVERTERRLAASQPR